MLCNGCGNREAFRTQTLLGGGELCDRCGSVGLPWVPDVFWDGKAEKTLADGPDGKSRVFGSKREKAIYLKQHHIAEAGDKVHGSFYLPATKQKTDRAKAREEIRKTIAHVQNMGRDYRRQQYLKIVKEAERHASHQ